MISRFSGFFSRSFRTIPKIATTHGVNRGHLRTRIRIDAAINPVPLGSYDSYRDHALARRKLDRCATRLLGAKHRRAVSGLGLAQLKSRATIGWKFYYVNTEWVPTHASKLNILADLIYFDSNQDDDLIIFLDGDAFPIGDIIGFARQKLRKYPLVAVQRLDNNGDRQPHPCFCVTTIGFWKRIGGDWNQGYEWEDAEGNPMTDVGGNLLGILQREGIEWYPMHRSNRINLHPLWFGIYEGLIYHHGAAFRHPISRIDLHNVAVEARGTWRWPLGLIMKRLTRPGRAVAPPSTTQSGLDP